MKTVSWSIRIPQMMLLILVVFLSSAGGPSVPVAADIESPFCSLPPDPASPWLPITPLPNETAIPIPRPASDCQFYRPAWQRFLVATQPTDGVPAFLTFPSFDQIFGPSAGSSAPAAKNGLLDLSPRNIQRPNKPNSRQQNLLDRNQAGLFGNQGGYLIDQKGRFVYYAIHFNPAFLEFLRNQNLLTVDGIKALDPQLTVLGSDSDVHADINTNVVEYKSAWMIVDEHHPPSNYFVVPARVPHYVVSGDSLTQQMADGKPKFDDVKVALLALHVVFTLPGHPEMIWSTFEHVSTDAVTGNVVRDNAPAAKDNPSFTDTTKEVSNKDFPLYKAHTLYKDANQPIPDLKNIVQFWNPASQSFTKNGSTIQTSVYRPYPGSKTDGSQAHPDHGEDDEINAMNRHATEMFHNAMATHLITESDQRQNYRLVGAIWLDQPASGPNPSFLVKRSFSIDAKQSTDDDGQMIAGEGRLGSTAMESFTEFEDGAPNCFSCHDTQLVQHKKVLIPPARLNVSHLLSKFMDTQLLQQN